MEIIIKIEFEKPSIKKIQINTTKQDLLFNDIIIKLDGICDSLKHLEEDFLINKH